MRLRALGLFFTFTLVACGGDDEATSAGSAGGGASGSTGSASGSTGTGGGGGHACVQAETCNGVDDDCNGTIDDGDGLCTGGDVCQGGRCRGGGAYVADKEWGTGDLEGAAGAGVQSDGTIVVGGNFRGAIDFGGGTRTPVMYGSVFVVGLDAQLGYKWDSTFGGPGSPTAWELDVGADDRIALSGQLYQAVDFGGGTHGGDGFALSLDTQGKYLWDREFGNLGYGQSLACSAGPAGSIAHAGDFQGSSAFGTTTLQSAGYSDVYTTRLDGTGNYLWAAGFGEPDVEAAEGVDTKGDLTATAGFFSGTVDMGAGPVTASADGDGFVVVYDAAGKPSWSVHFGAPGGAGAIGVAFCGDRIVATGGFSGTVDLLGASKTAIGDFDAFVMVLDATGKLVDVTTFGGMGRDTATKVSCGADGTIYAAGYYEQSADFGGDVRTSQGGTDLFVVALDAKLGYLWDRTYGGLDDDYLGGVTADAAHDVIVTGQFTGTTDFGGGPRTSQGQTDAFVVLLRD